MKRDFKHNDIRYSIVNSYDMNTKYNIMKFDTNLNAWLRVKGCNTIKEGYEIIRG